MIHNFKNAERWEDKASNTQNESGSKLASTPASLVLQWLLGALWKRSTYTLHLLLAAPLNAEYLHITITIAVGSPCKSRVLPHYIGCWGPLWKKSTYTSQLLPWELWKQSLAHSICYWGPFWKQST